MGHCSPSAPRSTLKISVDDLSKIIGFKSAYLLEKIHYLANRPNNKNEREGHLWVYKSLREMFSWLPGKIGSKSTAKRIVKKLEQQNLLVSRNDLNHHKYVRTKWYRVNYDQLSITCSENYVGTWAQNEPMDGVKMTLRNDPMDGVILTPCTITTPETSFSYTYNNNSAPDNSKENIISENPVVVVRLNKTLKDNELHISENVLLELLSKYGERQVSDNVWYTGRKLRHGRMSGKPIVNPAAYLRDAIENNYADTKVENPDDEDYLPF